MRRVFDVVSIRPLNLGANRPASSRVTPGRFEMIGTAQDLIALAFGVERQQKAARIVAAPDWARRELFEIRALMPDGVTERNIPEMLNALLEDRFSLQVHVEQRPLPVFKLVVLPSGAKLREVVPVDDFTKPAASFSGAPLIGDNTFGVPGDQVRTIYAADGLYIVTSRSSYVTRILPSGARQLDATRITMSEFIDVIRQSVDRPIVDGTGLTGLYEIKVLLPLAHPSAIMPELRGRVSSAPSGVSISRALADLGLTLEGQESAVDFIVVDNLARPSEN